jgi:putative membrane protein
MIWVKAFHIIFMVTWFAGLFYLPRLFVYHADCDDAPGRERFKVMERKLFIIMTIGAIITVLLGLVLIASYAWEVYRAQGWLHTKLVLVAGLIGFHVYCGKIVRDFRDDNEQHSGRYFRLINEIPALLLIAIVLLAIVKPF